MEAIKLTINALPTRSRVMRGIQGSRTCRAGCNSIETMGHVLQVCPRTHGSRVKRHDKILNKLKGLLEGKGFKVKKEPVIQTSLGLRKPDMVILKDNNATVLDLQIGGDYGRLDRVHEDKCR